MVKYHRPFWHKILFPSTICGIFLQIFGTIAATFLYAEFVHHYVAVGLFCSWPHLEGSKVDQGNIRAILAADPHVLGHRYGHWFDKLRREWAMKRSYQAAYALLSPGADATFVLGDLTDEGEFTFESSEMAHYKQRFDAIFTPNEACPVFSLVGNHDVGFHYKHVEERQQLFDSHFIGENLDPSSSVRKLRIGNVDFVLLNSMAFEGDHDHCKLCDGALKALEKLSQQGFHGQRPILLQHFPLFRENDLQCPDDVHAMLEPEKSKKTRPRIDVISSEASKLILDKLNPRFIISGHTHFSCRLKHGEVEEISVPSFSWRNNKAPALLLLVANGEQLAFSICPLADERTIYNIYIFGGIFLFFACFLRPILMALLKTCSEGSMTDEKVKAFPSASSFSSFSSTAKPKQI